VTAEALVSRNQTCKTKTKTKTAAYKTKTKTSFCWSETGLVTRPRSQTTSLIKISSSVKNILSKRFST